MIKKFKTRTGAIFCDTIKNLEYLYVGDYGKENNIKADFLGFTKEINQVKHHPVDLSEKMVVTISTQKGCPMNCMFCDCPKVKFGGNASREELAEEVVQAIKESGCTFTKRFNLHLARMGEPSLNAKNVLDFLQYDLCKIVNDNMSAQTIHPVFTTMCPKGLGKDKLKEILISFCDIKNNVYDGEAGLQLSINSTDETQRTALFRGMSLSLAEISEICRELPMPKGRKYTLNFPVTDRTVLDPKVLSSLFDKEKFIVKITPIHETKEANANGINTPEGYYKYDVYRQFEEPLKAEGWEVIVFIPSKEEDEDRITCGNALLSMVAHNSGVEMIAEERERQIKEEGFDAASDDCRDRGELAKAAAAYAIPQRDRVNYCPDVEKAPYIWPFEEKWWKPEKSLYIEDRIRILSKAGALIAAEIDRLRRLEAQGKTTCY